MSWLPPGKKAAVCMSVDDVHPTAIAPAALEHVRELQRRHPQLRVTLFTTPDWRSSAPFPSAEGARLEILPPHTYRLDRHEQFCAQLREWPSVEIAIHGLHHIARGRRSIAEFDGASRRRCSSMLRRALTIFESARLPVTRGLCPPAWHATPALLGAMGDESFSYVGSARDLDTPAAANATTNGSGMRGLPLVLPHRFENGVVHITTNYQATSNDERAFSIIETGGLLCVKAHLLAELGTYRALDGLTPAYRDQLDALFHSVEDRYGDAIWWTTMGEVAARMTQP